MISFLLGAVAFFVVAALLLVFTRGRGSRAADADDPNVGWLRQREVELSSPETPGIHHRDPSGAEPDANRASGQSDNPTSIPRAATAAAAGASAESVDNPLLLSAQSRSLDSNTDALRDEAALRVLEDEESAPSSGYRDYSSADDPRSFWRLLAPILLVIIAASLLIYRETGSIEDVLIASQLVALGEGGQDVDRERLIARIEARSEQREENLAYQNLLGRIYMAEQNYAAASDAFGEIVDRAPDNPEALALAAQAQFLAAGRVLEPEAQLMAERALAGNPQQRTALGLLGMASFEQGAYAGAIEYWTRLQQQEPPDSAEFEMLQGVIAMARERLAPGSGVVANSGDAGSADSAPGISVELVLADGLESEPDAVVYVFARPEASNSGPPIAVARLSAGELPAMLRLTDANSMTGTQLSEAGVVRVFAQLSRNGKPGAANAQFVGVSDRAQASSGETAVRVVLYEQLKAESI
ncbi:MAG: cytochrome C biogenesis protein [Pseudomonadota bacterium]